MSRSTLISMILCLLVGPSKAFAGYGHRSQRPPLRAEVGVREHLDTQWRVVADAMRVKQTGRWRTERSRTSGELRFEHELAGGVATLVTTPGGRRVRRVEVLGDRAELAAAGGPESLFAVADDPSSNTAERVLSTVYRAITDERPDEIDFDQQSGEYGRTTAGFGAFLSPTDDARRKATLLGAQRSSRHIMHAVDMGHGRLGIAVGKDLSDQLHDLLELPEVNGLGRGRPTSGLIPLWQRLETAVSSLLFDTHRVSD